MSIIELLQRIPPGVRAFIYGAYAVAGVVLGIIQIVGEPSWFSEAMEVYAYLGIVLGITASANAPGVRAIPVDVQGRHEAPRDEGGYTDLVRIVVGVVVAIVLILFVVWLVRELDDPGKADLIRPLLR